MSIFTNNLTSAKEEAAAYTDAVLGLVAQRNPLEVLRSAPAVVRDMISGMRESVLAQPEAPGKWSVREVIAHLADSELVVGWRIRMIMAVEQPELTGVDQDVWAKRLHYNEIDAQRALATYAALREWNLLVFENATAAELERCGVHSERGNESIAHIIRLYAGHDILHQRQIARILTAVQP